MTTALTRREEWHRIRAERAATRGDLLGALSGLEARARDPFGLKEKFRKHPWLFAGAGAALGALVVNLVAGGGAARRAPPARDDSESDGPSRWMAPLLDTLRDAGMRLAMPWVAKFLADHLGETPEADQRTARGDGAAAQRN